MLYRNSNITQIPSVNLYFYIISHFLSKFLKYNKKTKLKKVTKSNPSNIYTRFIHYRTNNIKRKEKGGKQAERFRSSSKRDLSRKI